MQQDKHPSYRPVVFRDRSAGYAFLTRSTASSDQTIDWDDGNTYPVIDVEISAESHPFFTGKARVVDTEGQVAKFERRYGEEGARTSPDPPPTAPAPPYALRTPPTRLPRCAAVRTGSSQGSPRRARAPRPDSASGSAPGREADEWWSARTSAPGSSS